MTSRDVDAALLLAEGLGACARMAVEHRVSERAYLDLARSLYRDLAGAPRGGRRAASHGEWDGLLAAVGGQSALARALDVDRKSIQRWIARATAPTSADKSRVARLCARHGVPNPLHGVTPSDER